MWILLIYVCCSAGGLLLLKLGVNNGVSLKFQSGMFQFEVNWILLLGVVVYIVSFLLSLFAMSKMNLSYFYPISAGLVFVVVCAVSVFVFKEKISMQQLVGIGMILVGVIVMNVQNG